jgi:hypothetical protein
VPAQCARHWQCILMLLRCGYRLEGGCLPLLPLIECTRSYCRLFVEVSWRSSVANTRQLASRLNQLRMNKAMRQSARQNQANIAVKSVWRAHTGRSEFALSWPSRHGEGSVPVKQTKDYEPLLTRSRSNAMPRIPRSPEFLCHFKRHDDLIQPMFFIRYGGDV